MAARSQQTIYNDMVARYEAAAIAAGYTTIDSTKWSMYNLQRLIFWTVAGGMATLEQLWDAFKAVIEALVAIASPQTGAWFQAQMLKFQFNATNPQIIQFDTVNFAPFYPTVNTNLQVIKYCSVVPGVFGTSIIKVAAQVTGAPADLDTEYPGALAAAQSYANTLAVPGIKYYVQSGNSDKIYIAATIYYQGGYSAVISDDVISAIKTYLGAIPFNGVVLLSDIEGAIKKVSGVNDLVFTNVQARADATAYGSGTDLVVGTDGSPSSTPTGNVIKRNWATVSGYAVPEDTATHELTDSLYFIPE